MVETIKTEIGDNKISKKVGEIQRLENKIKESYKDIYETKGELQDLKAALSKNLSGEEFTKMLEKDITIEHVKNVLHQAVDKFAAAKSGDKTGDQKANDHIAFMDVYSVMGAGLVFNMQLGLAKLGCTFEHGIDGIYGSRDTTLRVTEFQHAWNASHPTDLITADGRAGEETLKKIIVALDDPTWDKTLIKTPESPKKEEPAKDKKEIKEEQITFLSEDDAMEDLEKYHLTDDGENLTPMPGYKWLDKKDPENYATVARKSNTEQPVEPKKENIITPNKKEEKEPKPEKKEKKENKEPEKKQVTKKEKKEEKKSDKKEQPKKIAPKPKAQPEKKEVVKPAPEKKVIMKSAVEFSKELPVEVIYKGAKQELSEADAKALVEKSKAIATQLNSEKYDFTGAKIVLGDQNDVRVSNGGTNKWYWVDMSQSKDAIVTYLKSVMKKIPETPVNQPAKKNILESANHDASVKEILKGKTISWKNIFTAADLADPKTARQIAGFKKFFTKSGDGQGYGIDLDDIKIVRENGTTSIKLDLDNNGEDAAWSTRSFSYGEIFTEQGKYDAALFGSSLRKQIVNDIFVNYKFRP